jgi:hypothetical protein
MGLFGVPVRTASKLNDDEPGVLADAFFEKFGSRFKELVEVLGIHADVESVGRTLQRRDQSKLFPPKQMLIYYRIDTMTLSSWPWSCLMLFSHASSISPLTSPTSTVCESTRTCSGSTLLTSISLVEGIKEGLSAPLRLLGVPGVLGRLCDPSFFVGVPGTGANVDLDLKVVDGLFFERDSTERGALYFLCVEFRRIGVLTRERRALRESAEDELLIVVEVVDTLDWADRGRLGVNGAGRTALDAEGVEDTLLLLRPLKDIVGARAEICVNDAVVGSWGAEGVLEAVLEVVVVVHSNLNV